jgi:hypothetical protein
LSRQLFQSGTSALAWKSHRNSDKEECFVMVARKKITESPPRMDHAERRSQPRRRVLKGAIIRFNKGYGAFECVVRNLSENGAKLTFGDTSAVPAVFELKIAGDQQMHEAHVRWRSPDSVGVSFA